MKLPSVLLQFVKRSSLLTAGCSAALRRGRGLIVPALMFGCAPPTPAEVVRLGNAQLQIGIEPRLGHLVELVDGATGHNFIQTTNLGALWELELSGGAEPVLHPARARSFASRALTGVAAHELVWSDFDVVAAPRLQVRVHIAFEVDQPMSRWGLAVEGLGGLRLGAIRFPRVINLQAQPAERLAVPVWMGQQAANPRALLSPVQGPPQRWEWHYPGLLSLQCLALTSAGGVSCYLACDDAGDYLKDFAAFATTNADLNLEIRHRPEPAQNPAQRYELPYSVVLGSFRGDWFQAAERYRAWATNQSWAHASRLQNGLAPAWVTNTALWVWNRGASPGVIEPAIALQRALGLPVSVFWHWWHGCAYDTGFPEYLPPREGEAAFRAALQTAHAHDVRAIVYMNQRLWGMTTASWTNENAARFAVKAADGQIHPEVYNTFSKLPCASMCMGTEFWRHKYASLATAAFRGLGVDGIYMDQACSSLACYDPAHGHSLGSGTYWMRGFQKLAAAIRQQNQVRAGPALAGEGCGENWLPHLDLMLALQVSRERYAGADGWETIPFFHAVYHDYAIFFGNYSSLTAPPYDELWPAEFAPKEPLKLLDRKFATQFRLEQARAFIWGQQPTLANFRTNQLTERAEELAFVLKLARLRAQALPYLLHGQLLPPPEYADAATVIPMSRLSIYAGQQGGVREFEQSEPLLHAATWRARDGAIAVVVVNIGATPMAPRLTLDRQQHHLPATGRIQRTDASGRRQVGAFAGREVVLQPALAAADACILELRAD
ncbi:MAG TPA: DUF6259 domain-containing protein [Verrucomicrobiota bacterium]|nr:DUF6259 domain-containing protein [Verrucomicrobiota bacterium]HNT13348.1 DUF6259 domain-containing protein [Verrucomicrobiota bacterium]